MKRSRVALLLFMATFACSLLAAGMAGGEGGAAAQPLSGGSSIGGYCEFAYDPVDEEPYDSCQLEGCEFAGNQNKFPTAKLRAPVWSDDDSLDYYEGDSIDPAGSYQPPKVSASMGERLYGLPAEDEIPLGNSDDEIADPDLESQSRVDAALEPSAQVLDDTFLREPYDYGSYTRHCWPELYGDTDLDSDPYVVADELTETVSPVSELLADLNQMLDDLASRPRAASPAEFVRLETATDIEDPWSGFAAGDEANEGNSPEIEVLAAWALQAHGWVAQQDWLAREFATINARAEYYLQGLTPPPAVTIHLRIDWASMDLGGRAERLVSDLLGVYADAIQGLSHGVAEIASLPGLFDKPVRQAQDPSVRTRTSLRTPWRIDL
jgi:hypothetical protein